MARNILIFSDGTGQAGGLAPDERRSNIYKLYRATRVGPDSSIDPAEQVAYYDAGLGSRPPGGGGVSNFFRIIYNLLSQATGFGLTANIVDCYEMIVRLWRPGDRIFLFGFSRGAYTARCLAGVLALCGVPTRLEGNRPMRYDSATARRLARKAVKKVYQHASSKPLAQANAREKELIAQRQELARQYRETYGVNLNDTSNYPYFIGAFDTVASVASRGSLFAAAAAGFAIAASIATVLWGFGPEYTPWFGSYLGNALADLLALLWLDPGSWWSWFLLVLGLVAIVTLAIYLKGQIKFAPTADRKRPWRTFSISFSRIQFEDMTLNDNVAYARHAIAIDEDRASFNRVPWGGKSSRREHDEDGVNTFEQIWFAGNHGDIGGIFAENESRLSDIALAWMVDAAVSIRNGLKIDRAVLRLYPAHDAMQHDQRKVGLPIVTRWLGWTWSRSPREIPWGAPLHPSVFERFRLEEVLQLDAMVPYRPEGLRYDIRVMRHYPPEPDDCA